MADSLDYQLSESGFHFPDRLIPGISVNHQLADHGIIKRRNKIAGIHGGFKPYARASGNVQKLDLAAAWAETVSRVLGVDTALDCVAL